jgi:hypothetical protein
MLLPTSSGAKAEDFITWTKEVADPKLDLPPCARLGAQFAQDSVALL